jgi:hypothetical protein
MLQMTLHLTRSSRVWTLLLLGLEVFQLRSQKNATLTVSIEIHNGAIFDRLKIKYFTTYCKYIGSNDLFKISLKHKYKLYKSF